MAPSQSGQNELYHKKEYVLAAITRARKNLTVLICDKLQWNSWPTFIYNTGGSNANTLWEQFVNTRGTQAFNFIDKNRRMIMPENLNL